nr:DUF3108 domain-containing protein [candidate division Zixibacteria bacterium]
MVKKILIVALSLITFATGFYFIEIVPRKASAGTESPAVTDDSGIGRYEENLAFGIGEILQFDIGYGFINAGYATMEVKDLIEYNGRPCYLLISTANSNRFFSSFYRVEDRVESVFDARGLFSWHFEKKLSEGSYQANKSYSFDQENHRVIYENDTLDINNYIQDALSILYYVRTRDLKIGESIYVDNFTDGKSYPMEVRVLQKETVKVKAGKFDCLVVEPLLLSAGIFQHEGRLKVWLTDDRLKLPVLMKSKVLVGSISAELTDYQLGEILDF